MKPIHKKRIKMWVDALMRSKKQTRGTLKNKEGRCCLGVACDVYKRATKKGGWKKDMGGDLSFLDEECGLPERVVEWFGLDRKYPQLEYENKKVGAEELNDNYHLTFAQIAQCIKETHLNEKGEN